MLTKEERDEYRRDLPKLARWPSLSKILDAMLDDLDSKDLEIERLRGVDWQKLREMQHEELERERDQARAEITRLRSALEEIDKSGCTYECNRTRCTSDVIARRALEGKT